VRLVCANVKPSFRGITFLKSLVSMCTVNSISGSCMHICRSREDAKMRHYASQGIPTGLQVAILLKINIVSSLWLQCKVIDSHIRSRRNDRGLRHEKIDNAKRMTLHTHFPPNPFIYTSTASRKQCQCPTIQTHCDYYFETLLLHSSARSKPSTPHVPD
jgi:hypothetical protein